MSTLQSSVHINTAMSSFSSFNSILIIAFVTFFVALHLSDARPAPDFGQAIEQAVRGIARIINGFFPFVTTSSNTTFVIG